MSQRKAFEMSQEDLDKILDACNPVPYMVIGGYEPKSPQENANIAWEALGQKMGFDYLTVEPDTQGRGNRFFTAITIDKEEKHNE